MGKPESRRQEPEMPAEALEAAMAQLRLYEVASEYIDRDMMREILRAALSRIKRAP
jgi:hypothetical protein